MELPPRPVEEMSSIEWFSKVHENLTACLKLLLETKHLYQSATVELDIWREPKNAQSWKLTAARAEWAVFDADSPAVSYLAKSAYDITVHVPDVKLFCHRCERVEAFNSISRQEFTRRGRYERKPATTNDDIQVFVLSFLCQSCKGVPEVFIVRRQGLKLTLCGRAPMEVADVPPAIPRAIRQYYSSALVAHQSGQTLAGLFLLRTLIEQWARSQIGEPAPPRADELMDKYMAILPGNFKSQFPSMRSLYDNISVDIHTAVGSGDLFDSALAEITEHFDARRLFKL
jgi:hypothetical protein